MDILKEMLGQIRQSNQVRFAAGLLVGFSVLSCVLGIADPETFRRGIRLLWPIFVGSIVVLVAALSMIWLVRKNRH